MSRPTPPWRLDAPERLAALAAVEVVPGVVDPLFDPYTRLVTRLLGVPVSLVSFVTAHEQIFASAAGLEGPWGARGQTPLEMSFCQHVVTDDAPLRVDDAPRHERVATNGAIDELGVQAYLGVPLRAPGGEPLGSLCAIDTQARVWTDDHLAALQDIGDAASAAIALRVGEHRQRADARETSHRMRTPITGLRLELEDLLLHDGLDAETQQGLRAARDRVDDVSLMVDGLLDSVRERTTEQHEDVDLVKLTASVAERRRLAATGDHVVHVAGPPVVVRSSPTAVRRIVELLVEQAVGDGGRAEIQAAAGEGTGRIQVRTAAASASAHGADGLTLAHELAAGIGARITPLPGAAGFELVLLGAPSLRR